jgi:integrase
MDTTYDVRIWELRVRVGERKSTYYVRWRVSTRAFAKSYPTKALAESFRADLVAAARKGEAFSKESGLPVSMHRAEADLSWFAFSRDYVDQKWDGLAGNSRRNTAYSLSIATLALVRTQRGKPDDVLLNRALAGWHFNIRQRDEHEHPDDVVAALLWLSANTRPMSDLAEPAVVRAVLDRLTRNADGSSAAPDTVLRRRGVLHDALNRAVERKLFPTNPMDDVKWTAPRVVKEVDTRVVANPIQARTLLLAVREQKPNGLRWLAFFALMYYAALRPEEAVGLCKQHLSLPDEGWGELHLEQSAPVVGRPWSDTRDRRDTRPLKHRAKGEVRTVPCHPELTRILHEYIDTFRTTEDGHLFRALNGGELAESTYYRVWRRAREDALTAEVAASPLASRPYDLRHACVSTWLTGGVPATQVALWAGHSVAVLLQIYAKCLDGQSSLDRRRIEQALGGL